MSDNHVVVNVEEQVAKRLYDSGELASARKAILDARTLDSKMDFADLEAQREVPIGKEEAAARKVEIADAAGMNLRRDRNALLQQSDWTQLPDIPEDTRRVWAAYRQKLRDLPETTSDPTKVRWPKPPGE